MRGKWCEPTAAREQLNSGFRKLTSINNRLSMSGHNEGVRKSAEAMMHSAVQAIPQKMQVLVGSSASLWREGCWAMSWQAIDTAPFGHELHLSTIENGEVHPLAFPCWRTQDGWLNCLTNELISIHPTHWRNWRA
jgi:hypothetical protein